MTTGQTSRRPASRSGSPGLDTLPSSENLYPSRRPHSATRSSRVSFSSIVATTRLDRERHDLVHDDVASRDDARRRRGRVPRADERAEAPPRRRFPRRRTPPRAAPSRAPPRPPRTSATTSIDWEKLDAEFQDATTIAILDRALEIFGDTLAIAFSGAEDVALIQYASLTGRPFRVFSLDTGRLKPGDVPALRRRGEALRDQDRVHVPGRGRGVELVNEKGMFSFYEDGHKARSIR